MRPRAASKRKRGKMIDLKELEELKNKYLETLDDDDMREHYTTERRYARKEIDKFSKWLVDYYFGAWKQDMTPGFPVED